MPNTSHVVFVCIILFTVVACNESPLIENDNDFIGSVLIRVRRQSRKKEDQPIDWENVDETLYGWEPTPDSRCEGKYICRDLSYCFGNNNLCNNFVSCDDQSDEINSLCGYTTVEVPTTTAMGRISEPTDDSSGTQETVTLIPPTTSRNRFNDPLVIAFLVFVVAMLVYVITATVCCIKMRLNAIRPGASQGSAPTSVTKSPQGMERAHHSPKNGGKEPTGDRVFTEKETPKSTHFDSK